MSYIIEQCRSLDGRYIELHRLLDLCYSKPPRDVFYRFLKYYHNGYPTYLARWSDKRLVGFVYLSPNSKGGTLECLAVHPGYRGYGIAGALIRCLKAETTGVISLTTRIPNFFVAFDFKTITKLPDESIYMIHEHKLALPETLDRVRNKS